MHEYCPPGQVTVPRDGNSQQVHLDDLLFLSQGVTAAAPADQRNFLTSPDLSKELKTCREIFLICNPILLPIEVSCSHFHYAPVLNMCSLTLMSNNRSQCHS